MLYMHIVAYTCRFDDPCRKIVNVCQIMVVDTHSEFTLLHYCMFRLQPLDEVEPVPITGRSLVSKLHPHSPAAGEPS